MIVAGHRGAAGLAPENTLAGFQKAWETGVRMVELDVRLTADAFPVCFHDDRLDRLTSERGLVSERPLEELLQVRVLPEVYRDEAQPTRIPLLQQALAAIPEDTEVLVELKPEPVRPGLLIERTLEAVGPHAPRCRFISFDHDLLRRLRAFRGATPPASALRLGVLTHARERDRLIPVGRELRAEALHCPHAALDPEWLAAARSAGFRVNAWTVNSEDEWRRMAELGPDEVTTDFPDRALAFFAGGK